MILKTDRIADRLKQGEGASERDPLIVVPAPDEKSLRDSGQASVDLRLGTWFAQSRQARMGHLSLKPDSTYSELTTTYVPFGQSYMLHPQSFVLAMTLEWICLPNDLAAYVVGKSSLGRAGLIIATAIGVHPGYKGCLTLELSNVGEIPIEITPGLKICQLFLHCLESKSSQVSDTSRFGGSRRPIFKPIEPDALAKKLSEAYQGNRLENT